MLVGMDVGVIVSRAVGSAVTNVHGAVQGVDTSVRMLLLRGSLRCATDIQNLSVVPLPGLALPQFPGLSLDPGREVDEGQIVTKIE